MIRQEHFGKKFYLDKKTGYWISTCCPKIRAHRWVWNNIHGIIPKGYHIHHKNEDKSDNRIENLELIHSFRHLSLHANKPENKERMRKVAEKYRDLTKLWHASEEGKTWHRLHAIKCKFGLNDPIKYKCQQCGNEYLSRLKAKSRTRFCSNACKSKWRRIQGLDDISKKCVICLLEFKSNKYSKTICCSKKCAAKYRWKKNGLNN